MQFENITKLEGHHAEVWCLAMSKEGNFIVSGSHDRSIRVWERTSEQLFIEEERDRELETMMEQDFDTENERERTTKDKVWRHLISLFLSRCFVSPSFFFFCLLC